MENKIEVGEYVRTKKGDIDKIDRYIFESNIYHCENGMCIDTENRIGLHLEDIVKHSKNIIDLIEVGDYVNGYKVLAIEKYFEVQPYRISIMVYQIKDAEFWKSIEEVTLEDVVTKEQFESVKYKV